MFNWAGLAAITLLFTGCMQYSRAIRVPDFRIASTPDQRRLVGSRDSSTRLGRLLDAAHDAWARVRADSSDKAALDDYNFAVARIVEEMERVEVDPENPVLTGPSATGGDWNLTVTLARGQPDVEILPTDRFRFRGSLVEEPVLREGIGAPVIAAGEGNDMVDLDPLIEGQHVFFGLTAFVRFDGENCRLEFMDPLEEEVVRIDGVTYSLAGDFTAPLVFQLAKIDPVRNELSRFLRPSRYNHTAHISRLQPYSPDEIPVLFIHGLANSPATWMPVLSHLRGDPVIREHFQFWFYSHPTGIPYPISAAELREQLDELKEDFPEHKDIIVVGHSMGGMISRLLMTDSKKTLWNAFFDRPPEEIPFSENTRKVMTDTLIFESREDISRIVFVSASHRGSDLASSFIGRLGARIVGNPIKDSEVSREAMAYSRAERHVRGQRHLPNSVQVLDPDSRWLQVVHTLPLDRSIPYHSIMGDRGRGGNRNRTRPQSTDGIVPFWSAHLEGAQSELIVPSGHWSHLHAKGMFEIKRILKLHLD